MAKKKFPIVVTPKGVAAYAYLTKPDTGGKFSDNKYKVTLVLDDDADVSGIKKACMEAAVAEWGPKTKPSAVRLPIRDGDEKGQDEFEGKLLLNAKSKFPPTLVDTSREPIETVFSGDVIKLSAVCIPHTAGGQKGVALQLRAVQLIEKRARLSGANDFEAFEDEDEEADSGTADSDDLDF